jgi:hypothetical protein
MTEQHEATNEELSALDRLVDDYRSRCLWFLRADYYPRTRDEILRVLRQIEGHGDLAAFQRAADIRRWLSRNSSESSAAS